MLQQYELRPKIKAVQYTGDSAQAQAIQDWVRTGEYKHPALSLRDISPFMLCLTEDLESAVMVYPGMYVAVMQHTDESEFEVLSSEEMTVMFIENPEPPKQTVLDYLNQHFNDWPTTSTAYEVGTVLHTASSRHRTNATIIGVEGDTYTVLTDIGNVIKPSIAELQSMYLEPTWVRELICPGKPLPVYGE